MILKSDIITTTKRLLSALEKSDKKQALWVLTSMFISSLVEIFALFLFLPILNLSQNLNNLYEQPYLKKIYETLDIETPERFFILALITLIVVYILKNSIYICVNYIQAKFCFKISNKWAYKVLGFYQNENWIDFSKNKESDILHNVVLKTSQLAQSGLLAILQLTYESIVLLLILASVLYYNPVCVLLLIAILFPTLLLTYKFLRKRVELNTKKINELEPLNYSYISQCIHGYMDAKLNSADTLLRKQYQKSHRRTSQLQAISGIFNNIPGKVIETTAVLGMAIIGFISIKYSQSNGIELFAVFGVAAFRSIPSAGKIMISLNGLKRAKILLNSLYQQITFTENVENNSPNRHNDFGELTLNDVSFSYNDQNEILNNINLTILKGDKIGIVGNSGSGKTTLMNLLLGFLQPTNGALLLDQEKLSPKDWQKHLSYVKQNVFIFQTSIRENIAFGENKNSIDDKKVWKALELASLDSFVRRLPHGLDTQLIENGNTFSGGQKQRLGISRALYKEPLVLFMDEATSALDHKTEEEITRSIEKILHTNITVIIIAHRHSTLRACNKIIELENGSIIRQCSYKDLTSKEV